jgi:hypothetical protein
MIFWKTIDKNQKKVLEKLYKRAFTQLSTILYSFQAKIDQSQPAFFLERRKYFLKTLISQKLSHPLSSNKLNVIMIR